MTLIGLRDLKIPYIEFHPLFNKSIEMKQEISQLKRLLDTSTLQEESNEDDDEFEEEEGEDFGEEGEEDFDEENYSEEE